MEPALKQRLVGAAVLVALAVIFLPMLVQGPAPDSSAADVPLTMPDAPAGEFETRELPLVVPAGEPAAEAAIIEEAPATPDPADEVAAPDATPGQANRADAAELADTSEPPAATRPQPAPEPEPAEREPEPAADTTADSEMLHAATAGGDYAVSFGSYSTVESADKVVTALRQSQLPAFRQSARVAGKTWHRVRIGPYATRAEAESARLRAAHVRDDVGARVVVLDTKAPTTTAPTTNAPAPAKPAPTTKAPAAADTGFAVQLAAFTKASDAIELRDRARAAGFSAFTEAVNTDSGTLTRVRIGPVLTREEAERLREQVRAKLGTDGVVRPHP